MSNSVWSLSVDLQTKTATFQSGLGDAARAARGSFQEIKDGAAEMSNGVRGASGGVNYSMMEARHSVMMLGEEVGVHLPRSLTMFISSLGPIGPALEAAFPFLAVILGATLLIEHLSKIGQAERELLDASHKLTDGMAENINKVDLEITNIELGIRKLAGASEWDLIAKKLRLEDAAKGMTNVQQLEAEIAKLLKAAPATSNWNPFNWGDASGEVQAKGKALEEQMRGKNQSEQVGIAQDALSLQSKILQEMKGQTDTSAAALHNQQTYVDFLKQETELLQKQADSAVLADQLQQGQDRSAKIKAAEDAQRQIDEIQQRGLDDYVRRRAAAETKVSELRKKAAHEEEQLEEDKIHANDAFAKALVEQARERDKLSQEAGKEGAGHGTKMAELQIAADKEAGQMRVAQGRMTLQEILDMEMSFAAREYNAKRDALNQEITALDTHAIEYENKKRALNNRLLELDKQFQNQTQSLEDQAQKKQLADLQASENRIKDVYAQGFTQVLMGKMSFGQMMVRLDSQMASTFLQNAMESLMQKKGVDGETRFEDARTSAANAFASAPNPIIGAVEAAGAFAAVMAFEGGGIVPGVGNGDIVPARLEPGEGVLTKRQMEGVINSAKFGSGDNNSGDTHIHYHHTSHVQAFNSDGVKQVLRDHGDAFLKHATDHIRKMNR